MFNAIFLQAAGGAAPMMSWVWIILIVVVFYFFMIRPQQQQQKSDHVITSGGLYGKIDSVITRTNKKGEQEVVDFVISLKPDGTKVQISKECVFKDLNDVVQQR